MNWNLFFRGVKALPDHPMVTDEDCKAYFKLYEKDNLDSLTQMYEIRREMGESIAEAFNKVRNVYLEILKNAVKEYK